MSTEIETGVLRNIYYFAPQSGQSWTGQAQESRYTESLFSLEVSSLRDLSQRDGLEVSRVRSETHSFASTIKADDDH
jgi:hypothetical protein